MITLAALALAACGSDGSDGEDVDPPAATSEDSAAEDAGEDSADDAAEDTDDAADTTDSAPADDDAESGSPDEESETEAPTDEETSDAGADTEVFEGEAGAAFLTPDLNIVCVLDEQGQAGVVCDPAATMNEIEELSQLDCDPNSQRPTIILAEGKVSGECAEGQVATKANVGEGGAWQEDEDSIHELWADMPVALLNDGQTLRGPNHECTVEGEDTVNCQDVDGEHGFTLAMDEFSTW